MEKIKWIGGMGVGMRVMEDVGKNENWIERSVPGRGGKRSARLVRLGTFCGHEQKARWWGRAGVGDTISCNSKPPCAGPSLHHEQHICQ